MAASSSAADAAQADDSAAAEGASGSASSTQPATGLGSTSSMYGSGYGMRSMYGGYGGYGGGMYGGGYGGGMYGGMGGMYGGMGGMGGMYGGGMGGSTYADSMFRMTQMLEMNSVMLDQLQEHVSMTYNRFRDILSWVWALKDIFFRQDDKAGAETQEQQGFESEDAKQEALQRVRRRLRVLVVLLGLFVVLALRDSRRQWRDSEADAAWLRSAEGLLPSPAAAAPAGVLGGLGPMGGPGGPSGMMPGASGAML